MDTYCVVEKSTIKNNSQNNPYGVIFNGFEVVIIENYMT